MRLSTRDHDRGAARLEYVYPVVSRRARGVSIGVNLNPNKACNWRCVYCQVPGLQRGVSPEIDLEQLERELTEMLEDVVRGDFMERAVPEDSRRLNDIALSGDGESTTSAQFAEVVAVIGRVMHEFELVGRIKLVLITNGSLIQREYVQRGLARMAELGGEVWFKLDSATLEGRAAMNDERAGLERAESNLRRAAELCPTWIQTCVLARNDEPPSSAEQEAYLALIQRLVADATPLGGVLLYGLERQSHQPEAAELSKLPERWLTEFAQRIEERGLPVRISV